VDPSEGLLKRLFTLLDGADPALIRKCSLEECDKIFYAKRLDQLCCSRACNCQRTAVLPASYAERLPPEFRLFDASGPEAKFADPWHAIASPSWPHPRWFCDECFWRHAVTLIPLPRK
jgi:hypothetical protein